MNEQLSVVLDFNAEMLARLDLEIFVGSVLKFLNCHRMQSGLNRSRIYLAFTTNSFLVYPLESVQQGSSGRPAAGSNTGNSGSAGGDF